jgi:hypothetical protein
LPPEGDRKRLVLLTGTRRNDAVGHWYTDPRGAPRILAPLDGRGTILDSAMAGGTVFIVRAGHDESDAQRIELLSLSTAAGAEWMPEPLPPLDGRASDPSGGWTLFRDGATLCAIGSASGAPSIARLARGTWTVEPMPSAEAGSSLGAFTLAGRVVTVARDAAAAPGVVPTVRLSVLRTGSRSAWSQFAEPARPWIAAAFGSDAVVLELDEAGRGSVRAISPSSNAPGEPVTLLPPGFASGSWVHLPLLAAVSVAFALAAMIFGSDAYLQSRLGKRGRAPRPLGAALSRRFLAFAIDAAPAFVACWFVVGGSPAPLLDHPLLSANIIAALPATLVLAGGWLLAVLGEPTGAHRQRILADRDGDAQRDGELARSLDRVKEIGVVVRGAAGSHPVGRQLDGVDAGNRCAHEIGDRLGDCHAGRRRCVDDRKRCALAHRQGIPGDAPVVGETDRAVGNRHLPGTNHLIARAQTTDGTIANGDQEGLGGH